MTKDFTSFWRTLVRNEIVLLPGRDKIASIQFLHISGSPLRKDVASTQDMDREFFNDATEPQLGLSFFKDMTGLRFQFVEFEKRFDSVESGSKQIVMFGVYLLTASIVVGALAFLLSMMASGGVRCQLLENPATLA